MKKTLLILASIMTISSMSYSQTTKKNSKKNYTLEEKQEIKKDKEALNLSKAQKDELKKIKIEKKSTDFKSMSKKDRKAAKKKFKERKLAVYTPEQRIKLKAIKKKKKEFKNN